MNDVWVGLMLICFGVSWPSAIVKTLRVKDPKGKSFVFLSLVVLGYVFGTVGKIVKGDCLTDWVFYVYLLDLVMVSTDLILSAYYRMRKKSEK